MTKFYVACGPDIREIVEADTVKEAGAKALQQHSDRTIASGERFALGDYVSVSETDFDAEDALWNTLDNVRKAAGIHFMHELPNQKGT